MFNGKGGKGPYRPARGRWQPSLLGLLIVAAVVVTVYYGGTARYGFVGIGPVTGAEARAVAIMERGIDVIAAARGRAGIPLDVVADPNETGLVGLEYSSITTTLGDLVAKRTATHPHWAAIIVRWMQRAGVERGDIVWATFSGSFPGFNLAVMAAAEALGAELIIVTSLAASTWGANIPEFPWSEMERVLHEEGVVQSRTIAWTLGGDADKGPGLLDIFGDGEQALRDAASRTGRPLMEFETLKEAVARRWEVFTRASRGRRPALYVNAGGGHASLGDCMDAHRWPSGLTWERRTCQGSSPGLLYVVADEGIPVLHLLNAKTLALRVGIPVDARFSTSR